MPETEMQKLTSQALEEKFQQFQSGLISKAQKSEYLTNIDNCKELCEINEFSDDCEDFGFDEDNNENIEMNDHITNRPR